MKAALAASILIVLAGCGANEVPPAGTQASSQQHEVPAAEVGQPSAIPVEPMLMREATVTLEVEDCARTMEAITTIAADTRGVLVSTDLRVEPEVGRRSGTAVVKVPASSFNRVLDDLDALALVSESRNVTVSDVTEEFVDLDARLRVERALEARYLQLVQGAGTTTEALEVERALAAVREGIERIEGRRRYLSNRVELSTITVTFHEPEPLLGTLGRAFGLGRSLCSGVTSALVVVAVGLSPLALLAFLALLIGRAVVRRQRGRAGR